MQINTKEEHFVPAQRVHLLLQLTVLLLYELQLSGQALLLLVDLLPRRSLGVEVRGVDLRLQRAQKTGNQSKEKQNEVV